MMGAYIILGGIVAFSATIALLGWFGQRQRHREHKS
jgi:hypothetical protein